MERVQYDEATKQQILARVAAGEPYRKVADETGLPHGTVYSWIARARKVDGNGQTQGACMQGDACMQDQVAGACMHEPEKPAKRKRRHVPSVRSPDGRGFPINKPVPDEYQCTARSKRTGERCKQPKAEGYQVCRWHGAGGGPPPGNKNALKHGGREHIWFDTLTEEEQMLLGQINLDKLAQVNAEIQLYDIRIRRMLQRIAKLADLDFTVVKQRYERKLEPVKGEDEDSDRASIPGLLVDKEEVESHATLGQIIRIEEALTKVQEKKVKLLELKHKIEAEQGGEKPNIQKYLEALAGTAAEVWDDGDEDPDGGDN